MKMSAAPGGGALVDTPRDLACPDLWQQSLERSLARRGKPTRSSLELFHLQPERDLSRGDAVRESLRYSQMRRSAVERRPAISLPSAGGISALALLAAATLPGLFGGRGGHAAKEQVAFRARSDAKTPDGSAAAVKHSVGLAMSPGLTGNGATTGETTATAATSGTGASQAAAAAARAASSARTAAAHARALHAAAHTRTTSSTSLHPAPRHLALAHDAAASGGVSGAAAHAHSGGAAPAANVSAAVPRVPGSPQPSGHPSTGGGALEDASHTAASTPRATSAPARVHVPTRVHVPKHALTHVPTRVHVPKHAPTHVPTRVHVPTHALTGKHSLRGTHALASTHALAPTRPVATHPAHPVTKTDSSATTHPVATSHPAPKPAAPAAPVTSSGYTNPLAGARVTPERIDQGVDYSGSGTLGAIGAGKVTSTSGTGWPGAFIEYQLTSGPDAGRYVYYAEGVSPAAGLYVGETLRPGQPVAQIIPGSSTGIEIGWGSGVGSQPLAAAKGDWGGSDDANSVASPEGKDFSALIASLGGPPGKIEG